MALVDDLTAEVDTVFRGSWNSRTGQVVPDVDAIGLGKSAATIDASVLYADLADSTALVDHHTAAFAAEIYKAYLVCSARIIKAGTGAITAYDGDRVMAVFVGHAKEERAVICGMKINWAIENIVNPSIQRNYSTTAYRVAHHVGIDTGALFVAKAGVRNDNDLVWVGPAANYAAKMSQIPENNTVFISGTTHDILSPRARIGASPQAPMWRARTWTQYPNRRLFSSNWVWNPNQ